MSLQDEDLFKPLSAKTGRKEITSDGRERNHRFARGGDARKLQAVLARRKKDAERRAKGGL